MTRRVADAPVMLENVPTHRVSPGAIGFCDLLTCSPHVNAVLVRTEALRAIGGFDAGIEHFDDWAAWLRIADRERASGRSQTRSRSGAFTHSDSQAAFSARVP